MLGTPVLGAMCSWELHLHWTLEGPACGGDSGKLLSAELLFSKVV